MCYGLLATDKDSYSLQATGPGRLMANHYLKLNTMAAIVNLGQRPNMPSLLRVICGAEEFRGTSLRRCGGGGCSWWIGLCAAAADN